MEQRKYGDINSDVMEEELGGDVEDFEQSRGRRFPRPEFGIHQNLIAQKLKHKKDHERISLVSKAI